MLIINLLGLGYISKIINNKSKKHAIKTNIESTNLHITATNQTFINQEDTYFTVTEKLQIDAFKNGVLVNQGQMTLRQGHIDRYFINEENGELNVLNQLTIHSFLNQGQVDVKNIFKGKSNRNQGILQSKIIEIEENLTNDGQIITHELAGKGVFTNHRRLELLGKGIIGVQNFITKNSMKKRATIQGEIITISADNKIFENHETIKTQSLTINADEFKNLGIVQSEMVVIGQGIFRNYILGEMKITDSLTVFGKLQNEGAIWTKNLFGTGKFINMPNLGKVQFSGTQQNPSRIEIHEFEGDFNQNKTNMMSLNKTSLIWKNVHWSNPIKEYMLPLNITTWVFDHVKCSKPITIHNHGMIQLKNSSLIFENLINHGQMTVSGGNYWFKGLSVMNRGLIHFQDQVCDFNVNFLNHAGKIQANHELKQKITIRTGSIKGKTIGKNLVVDIQKSLLNEGEMILWNLDGEGVFINKGTMQFTGNQQNHSTICIKTFENGSNDTTGLPAKLSGFSIVINGLNKTFTTHENSKIVAKKLDFTKTGDLHAWMSIDIKGHIQTNELAMNRDSITNLGTVETVILAINGNQFLNGEGVFNNNDTAILHVDIMKVDILKFVNNSTLIIDKEAIFTQKTYQSNEIKNFGYWEQNGNIQLNPTSVSLTNEEGKMVWKNAAMNLGQGLIRNNGDWWFENMTSATEIAFKNRGRLCLEKSMLRFSSIENFKDLSLTDGGYIVKTLVNHGLLSLNNNWTLKKDTQCVRHEPVLQQLWFYNYSGNGKIECDKQLSLSNFAGIPGKIRAKEFIRYSDNTQLTFNDLLAIETPLVTMGYQTAFPGFTTLRDYSFTTIKTLHLIINGPFSLHHKLIAEKIYLDINGAFSIGTSNTNMGTLAATDGTLVVQAHDIDARYGKIYGKKATTITALKGNLLCGASLPTSYNYEKNIGFAKEYCDPVQWKFAYTPVQDLNGAYIASDDSLDLKAKAILQLSYGQISSQGKATFSAEYIEAIRSLIQGRKNAEWNAANIYIGRAPELLLQLGWMSNFYPNEYMWAATSDKTQIHYDGDIHFNALKLTNLASIISSLKKIYIAYMGKQIDLLVEKPASVNFASQSRKYYTHSPKLISGEAIEIMMGDFTISATMYSPIFTINASKKFGSGTGTFYNPNRSRTTLSLDEPIVVDLTQSIAEIAKLGGIFNQLPNGKIVTDFPLGLPSTAKPNQMVYLNDGKTAEEIAQQAALIEQYCKGFHPIFNPLSSLDLNGFIHMSLSANAGRVDIKNQFGKKHHQTDLFHTILGNSGKWIQKNTKQAATPADIMAMTGVMMMVQLQKDAEGIRENLKLVIGPDEINSYQSSGDIAGEQFDSHTEGAQSHFNNRIVMENDINITSESMKRETQTYEEIYEDKYISIHQTKAMPQQQFISKKGSIKILTDNDIEDIGTHTEASVDLIEQSKNGNIFEKTVILPTTITTREDDRRIFSSTMITTTENLTHDFLQTTKKTGRKLYLNAINKINLEGSQHVARELQYWGLSYKHTSVLVANKSSMMKEENGVFTDKNTRLSQESSATAFAFVMAKRIKIMCDTILARGVLYQGETLIDGSTEGGRYEPLIKEMKHHQQVTVSSPLMTVDAGQEGGQEVEIKTSFHVKKIRHKSKKENPCGMIFVNAEWDKEVIEIIGAYQEQFYELKKWQREWNEKSQAIPDPVLIVVAIAVIVLTKGTGAGLVQGMTAASLSATQVTMANVALSSLAVKVSTSLLTTGDPIACVKEILSQNYLKHLALTIASAGIAEKIGAFAEINMNPGQKEFFEHVQEHTVRNGSSVLVNTLAGQRLNSKVVAQAATQIFLDSILAKAANNRGKTQQENPVNPLLHGTGHAIDAFVINFIAAKLTGEKNAAKIAYERAFGAFAGEVIAGFIVDSNKANIKLLETAADISRIVTNALAVALGFDAHNVDKGATNALFNNFMTAEEEEEQKRRKINYLWEKLEHDAKRPNPYEALYFPADGNLPHKIQRVYRGDSQSYTKIFNQGFVSRGSNSNLYFHVFPTEGSSLGINSNFISTSTDPKAALRFPQGFNSRGMIMDSFVYEITPSQVGRNVLKEIPALALTSTEKAFFETYCKRESEIAFLHKLNPQDIKGAWPVEVYQAGLMLPDRVTKNGLLSSGFYRLMNTEAGAFIPNPNYKEQIAPSLRHINYNPKGAVFWNAAKYVGHGLTGVGAALDAQSLYNEYQFSRKTGNFTNTYSEASRIVGGWTGAVKLGTLSASKALIATAPFSPLVQTGATVVSGLIGSIAGYYGGGEAARWIYNINRSDDTIKPLYYENIETKELKGTITTMRDGSSIGRFTLKEKMPTESNANRNLLASANRFFMSPVDKIIIDQLEQNTCTI